MTMSTGEKPLRWGLLGTARINDRIIKAAGMSGRSEVTAVASRDSDRASAYARAAGIPRSFGSYDRMLASDEVDIVYVSLPNWLHVPWGVKVAEAGKHALIEKPLVIYPGEMELLERAAGDNGVIIQEASMMRFHPQTALLRRLVSEEVIGVPRWVRGTFGFTLPYSDDIRLDRRGGGSLWDLGCYPVTLFQAVLQRRPVEVHGVLHRAGQAVDMTFGAQVLYEGGVIGQFVTSFEALPSWSAEFVGSQGRIRVSYPWLSQVELASTVEVVTRSSEAAPLSRSGDDNRDFGDEADDQVTSYHTFEGTNAYLEEVKAMERMILDEEPVIFPLRESAVNMATILALVESAETRTVVRVYE
ncbi:MAG: Gfo/Idh/MocA family oxidoreductase [bacterium]|nr:Gfo/Idh/MocA family oxidoreductase [bacterium]MDE0234911.1 Gfo/Idh/MocA family oxidoreductase [bacterium]